MKERLMRKTADAVCWVVYKMKQAGPEGPNAVCEQSEWDAMELAQPGYHTLIQEGITSENEAEKLAREAPGGTATRGVAHRLKARLR